MLAGRATMEDAVDCRVKLFIPSCFRFGLPQPTPLVLVLATFQVLSFAVFLLANVAQVAINFYGALDSNMHDSSAEVRHERWERKEKERRRGKRRKASEEACD
jgi:hypothetical protein